jgi:hypothetical protein
MPGELGNEDEQQGAGYYEHRYRSNGDDPPTDPDTQSPKPKGDMVLRVIKLVRNQEV